MRKGILLAVLRWSSYANADGADGTCAADDRSCSSGSVKPGSICTAEASDPGFARLCGWLATECNAEGLENVFLGTFDHGGVAVRGIGAANPISEGESVFCIPKLCWIVRGTEDVRVRQGCMGTPSCGPLEKLSIHLAEEKMKGNETFWAPYLAWLPTRDAFKQFHPAYLTGVDLPDQLSYWPPWSEELKVCHQVYSMKAQQKGRTPPTFEDVYEALVVVTTRTFEEVDLVPLADSANTEPASTLNVQQTYANDAQDGMCLNARRDIEAGEELLVDYGAEHHSAMLMFATYGFSLGPQHHNPDGHGLGDDAETFDLCPVLESVVFPDVELHDDNMVADAYRRFRDAQCSDPES